MVDADGNIVDEWTSGKEAHVIRELTVGKEYTLVETKPADEKKLKEQESQ